MSFKKIKESKRVTKTKTQKKTRVWIENNFLRLNLSRLLLLTKKGGYTFLGWERTDWRETGVSWLSERICQIWKPGSKIPFCCSPKRFPINQGDDVPLGTPRGFEEDLLSSLKKRKQKQLSLSLRRPSASAVPLARAAPSSGGGAGESLPLVFLLARGGGSNPAPDLCFPFSRPQLPLSPFGPLSLLYLKPVSLSGHCAIAVKSRRRQADVIAQRGGRALPRAFFFFSVLQTKRPERGEE